MGSVVSDVADGVLTERAASAALRTFFPEKLAAAAAAKKEAYVGAGLDNIATAAKRAGETVGEVTKQSWEVSRHATEKVGEAAAQSWEVSRQAGEKVGEATKHAAVTVSKSLTAVWGATVSGAQHIAKGAAGAVVSVGGAGAGADGCEVEQSPSSLAAVATQKTTADESGGDVSAASDVVEEGGGDRQSTSAAAESMGTSHANATGTPDGESPGVYYGLWGRMRGGLAAIGSGAKGGLAAIGNGAKRTVHSVTMQSAKAVDAVLGGGEAREEGRGCGGGGGSFDLEVDSAVTAAPATEEETASEANVDGGAAVIEVEVEGT